jgi:hypothetical protein
MVEMKGQKKAMTKVASKVQEMVYLSVTSMVPVKDQTTVWTTVALTQ